MVSAISNGVKIDVKTDYQFNEKNGTENEDLLFSFAYFIQITNLNDFPIQLLRRKWIIFDSLYPFKIIEGEGVVGEKPFIASKETYSYNSSCNIVSEIGYMKGLYIMKNTYTDQLFNVQIPVFLLIYPYKLN